MTDVLTKFAIFKDYQKIVKCETPSNQIINDITDCRKRLSAIQSFFNNTVEPDLIEACIYQINAINSEYNYLLHQAKLMDCKNDNYLRQFHISVEAKT